MDPILISLARGIQVVRDSTAPVSAGTPLHFHLDPRSLDLDLPDQLEGRINLTFFTKSVRFADALLPTQGPDAPSLEQYLRDASKVVGGQPVAQFQVPLPGPSLQGAIPPTTQVNVAAAISTVAGTVTPPPISQTVTPAPVTAAPQAITRFPTAQAVAADATDVLSGVPGLLGQVSGTVPLLVRSPVAISVSWKVLDENDAVVEPGPETFRFVGPENASDVVLQFAAQSLFVELTLDSPPVRQFKLVATVTLEAGTRTSGEVPLPAVPITLPAIPVPTVAILYQFRNYAGQTLICVPSASPVDTGNPAAHVRALLSSLRAAVAPLAGSIPQLGFLARDVVDYFARSAGSAVIVKADSISNLQRVQLRGWDLFQDGFNTDGMRAEDVFESLILVGPPGRMLDLFNAQQLDSLQGQLTVTTGLGLLVKVPDLGAGAVNESNQQTSVASEPAGATTVVALPAGSRTPEPHAIRTFYHEISSLRFS